MSLIAIKNADWILTMDGARRVIADGSILIDKDRIRAIGKSAVIEIPPETTKVIDGRGKVVLPGLIDSHTHHSLHLGRGLADECDIQTFLYRRLYPIEASLNDEDAYISALLCQLEMIKSGTTSIIDAGNYFPEATLRAFGTTGMRGVVARSTFDIPTSSLGSLPAQVFAEETNVALKRAEEFVERNSGACDGRVQAWLQLRVLPNCSDELCRGLKSIADRLGVRYEAHAAFTKEVYEASKLQFGKSEVRRLDDLGILGEGLLLAHMGWLTPRDILLLISSKTNVVLCPTSSVHQAMGSIAFGHVPELLEMGVNVALGTDGGPHGTNDLVRQIFVAAGGYKEVRLDATIMPPETVLEMATVNGARAMGMSDQVGSIEPGKKADITIFDSRRPEWRPLHNPVANLVYCANGNSADTVIVDGRILMENRKILTFNEDDVITEAQRRSVEIGARAGLLEYGRPRWPVH
ncbi:methylthioadenosine deaminase [Bradyrhizobiaceae bacterium SG-6C]|nr:methylthioadenosine deaminase [Bradyrhizobiaceae bacterium SG-6C]